MNSRLDRLLANERRDRRHATLDELAALQRRIDGVAGVLPDDLKVMLAELNTMVWEIFHDRTLH